MSDKSGIEWLIGEDGTRGSTWNPIRARFTDPMTGQVRIGWHCEHASEGCRFCYAEKLNQGFFQLGTSLPYTRPSREKVEIFLDEETLTQPLHWRRGRRVFPCSMTDAFADFVTDQWLDKMCAVAALCPQHTFLFLTKRTQRARDYFSINREERKQEAIGEEAYKLNGTLFSGAPDCGEGFTYLEWPLPNVMLGFSAENQENFDERWEDMSGLASIGWDVWCSAEPLLGPIDAYWGLHFSVACANCGDGQGWIGDACSCGDGVYSQQPQLSWMVVGGESGPNARPMDPAWARSLRDQCTAEEVPYFFKQHGNWLHRSQITNPKQRTACVVEGLARPPRKHIWPDGSASYFLDKKVAGRLLDGVEWNQVPSSIKEESEHN